MTAPESPPAAPPSESGSSESGLPVSAASGSGIAHGLYRLFLNRKAESDAAVEGMAERPIADLVRAFLKSTEFVAGPCADLAAGHAPWRGVALDERIAAWAAETLPLSDAGRDTVRSAGRSWAALYLALASDPAMEAIVAGTGLVEPPRRLAVLGAAAAIEGRLEEADPDGVRGWAVRVDTPDAPLAVELWVNGVFCAAATCDGFRRDIQDRFGGDGVAGFHIPIPEAVRSRGARLEIEIRPSGAPLVLGRAVVDARPPQPDLLVLALEELRHARRTLERLEARLPQIETRLSTPRAAYDAYSRAWPVLGTDVEPAVLDLDVVVEIGAASDRDLAQTLHALRTQSRPARRIVLVGGPARRAIGLDLARRAGWAVGEDLRFVDSEATTAAERIGQALPETVGAEAIQLLRAGDVPAPGSLAHIAAAFAGSPATQAVYGDEESFAPDQDHLEAADRRRSAPRLKPAFDPDLLAQTPYVGATPAFRRETLERVGLHAEAGALYACDAVLALPPEAVAHVPRVLFAAPGLAEDPDLWAACVAQRLGLPAEPHVDVLGANVPGAVRVRRAAPETTAAIIIPTRDALDLLRPCIDSLLAHADANRVRAEIIVIDHESREPETHAYLADLVSRRAARVIPYEGAFNWALMNNIAAAQTEADLLVFLNNDTVVLTPDWLDELAAEAMRPEVGVVGCRLVYGDGTLQHAGFVAREQGEGFLVHEGVGAAGDDSGYLGRHALLRSAAAVTGACMAVRAQVFHDLGGFDAASFPVEGNDVDLCLRARAASLRVLYDPYATLYHLESKTRGFNTSPDRQARAEAAAAILWARWGQRFGRDPGFNPHFDRQARPFSRLRPPPARWL